MAPLIALKALTRIYEDVPALDRIDLEVEPGSVYGLVGRNGAGKTTLLNLVAGLARPSSGEVRVMGENPEGLPDALRGRLAFVGEGQVLLPHLTCRQVVNVAMSASPEWDSNVLTEILDEAGIDPNLHVRSLSRGMKQQLRVALAYARRPRVLLLDEPVEGLDPVVRFDIFSRVLDRVAEGDACAMVSSHLLTDVERVVDRIGFLRKGRLEYDGTVDDLKDRFRRIRVAWRDGNDPGGLLDDAVARLEGIAFCRAGRQASFLTPRFSGEALTALGERLTGCMVEADRLCLEEIFVEWMREER